MELLKEVPGYKGILKAVIQLQIKQLIDVLSEQTGDECIVLVASVPDRTLCHLGTKQGEDYLNGKDQLKREFLQHCLHKLNQETTIKSEIKGDESPRSSPNFQNTRKRRQLHRKSPYETEKKRTGNRKSPKVQEKTMTGEVLDTDKTPEEDSLGEQIDKEMENETESQSEVDGEDTIREDDYGDSEMESETDIGLEVTDKFKDETLTDLHDEEFDYLPDEDAELCEKNDLSDNKRGISNEPKTGEKFIKGKSLDPDLRTSIIFEIIKKGGDVETGYVPRGVYTQVKNMFGLPATSSVTRRWECYIREEIMKKGRTNAAINLFPDDKISDCSSSKDVADDNSK